MHSNTSDGSPAAAALAALQHLAYGAAASRPNDPVLAALRGELQRLHDLVGKSYDELLSSIAKLGAQLPAAGDGSSADCQQHSAQQLAAWEEQCNGLSAGLLELDEFIRANVTALAQAAARHDATAVAHGAAKPATALLAAVSSHSARAAAGGHAAAGAAYTASVPQDAYHQAVYHIMAEQHVGPGGSSDAVLWGLSLLYARIRHRQELLQAVDGNTEGAKGNDWQTTDTFERKCFKYWVRPLHLLRVKLACARHLPLLVYGHPGPLQAGETSPAALRRDAAAATGLINSVYFDNPDMAVYHTRLRKDNGAQLVRVRWYGAPDGITAAEGLTDKQAKRDERVFVERKTHYESWSGLQSIKERAPLPLSQLPSLLSGSLAAGQVEPEGDKEGRKAQLLAEVQDYLTSWQQAPVLRTEYYRTAFQAYDSNAVRISMDSDDLFIREKLSGQQLSLLGFDGPLGLGDMVRFPYAILEVKLQGTETPDWIQDLQASDMLVDVKGFSKFIHASALLYPAAVQSSPFWFVPDAATGTMTPATIQEMADKTDNLEQQAAPWLFPEVNKKPTAPSPSTAAQPTISPSVPALKAGSRAGWLRGVMVHARRGSSSTSSGTVTVSPSNTASGSNSPLLPITAGVAAMQLPASHNSSASADVCVEMGSLQMGAAGSGQLGSQAGATDANRHAPTMGLLATDASKANSGDIEAGLPAAAGAAAEKGGSKGAAALSERLKMWVKRGKGLQRQQKAVAGAARSNEHMAGMQGGPRANALVRTRIEPKTFFAAERTYLAWMQIAVLIMLTGLGLLAGASFSGSEKCDIACRASQIAGTVITPVSVVFMAYSLFMYKARTVQIMRRETVRYDDQRGPILLTVLLAAVVIVSLVLELMTFADPGSTPALDNGMPVAG